MIPLDRTRE